MSTQTTVLLVEDSVEYLAPLHEDLEKKHNMKVYIATNKEDARRQAEEHWDELDVAILDVRLDEAGTSPTGPEIIMEVREKKKDSFAPEFIVWTSFDENEYYRFALNLGAAAYLKKGYDPPIIHTKVLALRRALNGKNPKIVAEVERIAAQSRGISDAILTFCRTILAPAFETYLGAPFAILFTEGETTRNCASNVPSLPDGSPDFYHTLQALAHGKGSPTEPFVLDISKIEPNPADVPLAIMFEQAAFLPLALSGGIKLSICILHLESEEAKRLRDLNFKEFKFMKHVMQSYEECLCSVLAQHLRPTVLENIISLWSQWTESAVKLNSIAKLCLRVGQEISAGFDSEDPERMLQELSDDLVNTSQYLDHVSRNWRVEGEDIPVRKLIETSWKLIDEPSGRDVPKLDIEGDCVVRAQKRDVAIIVSRLLQWFAYRGGSTPSDIPPAVTVKCETRNGGAALIFEDHSTRLPQELRRRLFETFSQAISTPFPELDSSKFEFAAGGQERKGEAPQLQGRYLPLYLVKILVEARYHGLLKDLSDEIAEHTYGHRILVQLPAANHVN